MWNIRIKASGILEYIVINLRHAFLALAVYTPRVASRDKNRLIGLLKVIGIQIQF